MERSCVYNNVILRSAARKYAVFGLPETFEPEKLNDEAILDAMARDVADFFNRPQNRVTCCLRPVAYRIWMFAVWFAGSDKHVRTYEAERPSNLRYIPCETTIFFFDYLHGDLYVHAPLCTDERERHALCSILAPLFCVKFISNPQYFFSVSSFNFESIRTLPTDCLRPTRENPAYPWRFLSLKALDYDTPGKDGLIKKIRFKGDGFIDPEEATPFHWHRAKSISLMARPIGEDKVRLTPFSVSFHKDSHEVSASLNPKTFLTIPYLLKMLDPLHHFTTPLGGFRK